MKTIERITLKVRSKCRSTVKFSLGNTTKFKYTQITNKQFHATLYLFMLYVKRKTTKHFNDKTGSYFPLCFGKTKPIHANWHLDNHSQKSTTTTERLPQHPEWPASLRGNCSVMPTCYARSNEYNKYLHKIFSSTKSLIFTLTTIILNPKMTWVWEF